MRARTLELVAGSLAFLTAGTRIYRTNSGGGTVMKVALAGGTPTTLASAQCTLAGVAVDSTSVYWTNLVGDPVMKLTPK